jgi:hypothetical protein
VGIDAGCLAIAHVLIVVRVAPREIAPVSDDDDLS